MKTQQRIARRRRLQAGYASMALVAIVGMVTLFGMLFTYRSGVTAHDSEKRSQIRVDYTEKEDALLRALIAIVPNKAIDTMRNDSRNRETSLRWETIFNEAIQVANAEAAVSANLVEGLGLEDVVIANPGDGSLGQAAGFVRALGTGAGFVSSGTSGNSDLLFDPHFQDRLPDPLEAPAGVATDDGLYPVVTNQKTFSSIWNTQGDLSVAQHPLFNRIPYPNVQFGYMAPGSPFIAKRNWWAFSLTFGRQAQGNAIAPTVRKNYVLSIYEFPSQLPISAETYMSVGRHENGTSWTNISIDGSVSAGILETDAFFSLPNGTFTGRRGLNLGSGTSSRGETLRSDFDQLGVRESLYAHRASDTYGASLSANSGRVAFVPINRGLDFYKLPAAPEANTISPTPWDRYSTGAIQCAMRVVVTEVESVDDQRPTRLDIHFKKGGTDSVFVLERGVNWPYPTETGGDVVPFQTRHLENGRKGLDFFIDRFANWLAAQGASPLEVNNSVVLTLDPTRDPDIKEPEFPTVETEAVVVLQGCSDFTAFNRGFSLVTNMRLYFIDDFNIVPAAPPAGAGLPAGTVFYPPVSIFAPEKRYGTTLKTRPVELSGQVGTLAEGDYLAFHPLDLRAGTYETVDNSRIFADLRQIRSPAELPPVTLRNWLVMVEEIHPIQGGNSDGGGYTPPPDSTSGSGDGTTSSGSGTSGSGDGTTSSGSGSSGSGSGTTSP
ncbi:MAG: hypothetical protein H7A53_07830 [Akkermansiaceae bacterium]|nr:hypothetical protein [Akkermansiaceae bacterium]MCP5550782.1 hypothetical protein [Akkermansiaceae bacterium]